MNNQRIVLRLTENKDINFVIKTESNPHNSQFIIPWTKQQHQDAFLNKDILHLIVEDKLTHKSEGYVILAGLRNPIG